MDRKTLCRVNTGHDEDLYLITTVKEEGKEGFALGLCDGTDGWRGQISEDDLDDLSSKIKMGFDQFLSETLRALTRTNMGNLNFQYSMKKSKDGAQFTWKKYIPKEDIRVQLGTISLKKERSNQGVMKEIFEHSIECATSLQDQITSLKTDNQRLAAERTSALKRLEKCVAAKEDLENDLFSKFQTVLNDKKAKMRDLQDELEDARRGIPCTSAGPEIISKGSGDGENTDEEERETKRLTEDDMDTDEEKTPSPSKKSGKRSQAVALESTPSVSLMLDDESQERCATPPIRRRRQREPVKKASTPASKTVIPRVTSAQKVNSRSRKSSGVSNRSSDNLDADDLLEDF